MTALKHTLAVLALAVVAVLGFAHADNRRDPCWIVRGKIPEMDHRFYFNLTKFAYEQWGITKDNKAWFQAHICGFTAAKHCGNSSSVCLQIGKQYYDAGNYLSREFDFIDGWHALRISMTGTDTCPEGCRCRSQFRFFYDPNKEGTNYECEYEKDDCLLSCEIHSKHTRIESGNP